METWSGFAAFSNEQREYFYRRRAEMAHSMRDYLSADDLKLMPIPFLCEDFVQWRKNDIKTKSVNPVQLALLCGRASAREEAERRYDLDCARDAELIDHETFVRFDADLRDRTAKRLACLRGLMKE
jgi:hypothetical protein